MGVDSNLSSLLKSNKVIRKKRRMTQSFLNNFVPRFFIVSKEVASTAATDLEYFLLSFTGLHLKIQLLSITELAEYASLIQVVVPSCTH